MLVNNVWGWRGVSAELNKQGNCYNCSINIVDPVGNGSRLIVGAEGVVSLSTLSRISGTRDDTPYLLPGNTVSLQPQSGDILYDDYGNIATVNSSSSFEVEYTVVTSAAYIHNVTDI